MCTRAGTKQEGIEFDMHAPQRAATRPLLLSARFPGFRTSRIRPESGARACRAERQRKSLLDEGPGVRAFIRQQRRIVSQKLSVLSSELKLPPGIDADRFSEGERIVFRVVFRLVFQFFRNVGNSLHPLDHGRRFVFAPA